MIQNKPKQRDLSEYDKRIVKKMKTNLLMAAVLVVPITSYFFVIEPIMTEMKARDNPFYATKNKVLEVIDEADKPEYKAFNSSLLTASKEVIADGVVTEKEYDTVMVEYEYFLEQKLAQKLAK